MNRLFFTMLIIVGTFFLGITHATAADVSNSSAEPPYSINVIQFPGGTALPLYVAKDKGFFAKQGLHVELTPTYDSRQLMTAVLTGKYQIGQAAIDNVIAYDEKQAATNLDLPRDLVAFMGTSSTNLSLVVHPSIHSYSDLEGKDLAVDAVNTGFAFVLRAMLKNGGLDKNEYKFVSVGGDTARLDALKNGKVSGSLLTTVFANQAQANGFRLLDTSINALHNYQGTSIFARKAWEKSHKRELVRFINAVAHAHRWIFTPGNEEPAAKILVNNSKNLSLKVATKTIRELTSKKGGLSRTGKLDIPGIQVVIDLREKYATPSKTLNPIETYINTSYYDKAMGGTQTVGDN